MKKNVLTVLSIAFPFCLNSAFAVDKTRWTKAVKPFPIAGPLYYVGTDGLCVYLVKTKAGLVLLGGAMPGSENLIANSIKELGFHLKDVRYVLVNHARNDHVGTTAALKKMTGASVYARDRDVELLKSGGKLDSILGPKFYFESVAVDRLVKDGEKLSIGGVEFVAHATPGHTPGCTTWETKIQVEGKRYSVVFLDGIIVVPGTRLKKKQTYAGIDKDFESTFRVLESLNPDIFLPFHVESLDVAKTHEKASQEGIGAWLNRAAYKDLVREKKQAFENFLHETLKI